MPPLASAILRSEIEAALADRMPSALSPAPRLIRQVEPTGIRSIDGLLQGGFPEAAITEIVGPECSGRTSLAFSFISGITHTDKVCAWVDISNAFHPESAAAAGIDLRRLFWVRCRSHIPTIPSYLRQIIFPFRRNISFLDQSSRDCMVEDSGHIHAVN
jgi:recombination protein RecA